MQGLVCGSSSKGHLMTVSTVGEKVLGLNLSAGWGAFYEQFARDLQTRVGVLTQSKNMQVWVICNYKIAHRCECECELFVSMCNWRRVQVVLHLSLP